MMNHIPFKLIDKNLSKYFFKKSFSNGERSVSRLKFNLLLNMHRSVVIQLVRSLHSSNDDSTRRAAWLYSTPETDSRLQDIKGISHISRLVF